MSHQDKEMICPNCGFHATENYCAQCGQPTHLHDDTFLGLITHFVGHYFHYDSKFWQTLKALWFSPGKLTLAYWNKQRMRYIPPISLYIFISAVFFLGSSLLPDRFITITDTGSSAHARKVLDDKVRITREETNTQDTVKHETPADTVSELQKEQLKERIVHNIPKVFFLMIPVMALLLQLLFIKRRDLLYVHHVIWSLHFHSFWFSVMFLTLLMPTKTSSGIAVTLIMLASAVYFVQALRKVYHSGWGKSILVALTVGILYLVGAVFGLIGLFSIILPRH